jgi:hypothetical protein
MVMDCRLCNQLAEADAHETTSIASASRHPCQTL